MADIAERMAAAILCVALASGSALLASALCLSPNKAALWTERTINWALRIQAFIVGLLLASTFLAALPFVNYAFQRLLDFAQVTAHYPLAEFGVCFGFLIVWGVHLICSSASSIRKTCCQHPPVSIEMQVKKRPPQQPKPPPPPPKVADISSSEEDVLYDAGEEWTPLNGPSPPASHSPVEMEDSDDNDSAVAAKLLNDSTVSAAAAERASDEAERKAGESFVLCFGHLALLFGLIAAIPDRTGIWMLALAAAGHALLAVHRLCAALVAHYMPVLVFGFCFLCLTISSSFGLAIGFFLHAKEDEVPFQVASCLLWSLATGSQLYNACNLSSKLADAKLPSIQHFLGVCAAFVVMAILRAIGS